MFRMKRSRFLIAGCAVVSGVLATWPAKLVGQTITEVINSTGDGANPLTGPQGVAVASSGNVYVSGGTSHNVFRITLTPAGDVDTKMEIIDETGNGSNPFLLPGTWGLAVDRNETVYATASGSHNAFKITLGGLITQIIDSNGNEVVPCIEPKGIAVDDDGNVYVACYLSHNVFKIAPSGGITEIIDSSGDDMGNVLENPFDVALDGSGNVYVTGRISDNAFKITPSGVITEIIDSTGDKTGNLLDNPQGVAADGGENVFVASHNNSNVFKITPAGDISRIMGATGNGTNPNTSAAGVAADSVGNVYVSAQNSDNVFRISFTPAGDVATITQIIDATGDGMGHPLEAPHPIAVSSSGHVFVAGFTSNNAFRITPAVIPTVSEWGVVVMVLLSLVAGTVMFRRMKLRQDA